MTITFSVRWGQIPIILFFIFYFKQTSFIKKKEEKEKNITTDKCMHAVKHLWVMFIFGW